MNAVDTNLLVRLFARDDADQVRLAEQFVAGGSWVSHIVLVETVWVLESVYHLGRSQLHNVVAMLLEHQTLVLQEPQVVAGALQLFAGNKSVGFSDCMILAIARKHGYSPVGSFDRKFARLKGVVAP